VVATEDQDGAATEAAAFTAGYPVGPHYLLMMYRCTDVLVHTRRIRMLVLYRCTGVLVHTRRNRMRATTFRAS